MLSSTLKYLILKLNLLMQKDAKKNKFTPARDYLILLQTVGEKCHSDHKRGSVECDMLGLYSAVFP